jgi:hypothetical protein
MSLAYRKIAVVGSREFRNWEQLKKTLDEFLQEEDRLVSGGATGADSFAQRYAKETGRTITIHYPKWRTERGYDAGAGFARNRKIVEDSDTVIAFYQKGRFQQGGTRNSIEWSIKLGKDFREFEEE